MALVRGVKRRPVPWGFAARLKAEMKKRPSRDRVAFRPRPLALGLVAALAGVVLYQTVLGPEPEPPAAPIETAGRPEPKPVLAAGNIDAGYAVGEKPKKSRVTNEAVMKAMQQEAEDLKIEGIAPRSVTRRRENPYQAMAAAELAEPGSREQILAYMRRFRAMRTAWSRAQRPPVPVGGDTVMVLGRAAPAPAKPADRRTDWAGLFSGSNAPGTRTISDMTEWRRVWAGLSTQPAPEIDFSLKQVVAVFLGHRESGGHMVEITGVSTSEALITVSYREISPPPGITPPEGATSPFALKVLPRSTLPVRFLKVE